MIDMKDKDSKCKAKKVLQATKDALSRLDKSISSVKKAANIISEQRGDIIVVGLGKSGFIGQKIAATLTSLGQRASFLHPVEALHGDIGMLSEGDSLVALSFSGESKEVIKITTYAKEHFKVPVVVFTKNKNSSLGKLADCCVEIKINSEGSPDEMAPMASSTATLVLGDMLAAVLTSSDFKKDSFAKFHPSGSIGLKLKKVKEFMKTKEFLPIVNEKELFHNVLKEMNNENKKRGVAGVVDINNKLVGIITDGDIRRILLQDIDIDEIKASSIMTKNPKLIRDTDSLELALAEMENHKVTHLFVVNLLSEPVGVIHIHDIVENTLI